MWVQKINDRFYYGWVVVGTILVVLTFVSGLSFYNHSIILNALAKQPSFTVESASLAVSLFFISGGFTGLWVAKLLTQFDPRVCITIGSILSAFALCALSYVVEIWQLYCVYIVFGMGFAGSSLIPATTLITRWFQAKRAMALSIASTGLSLGGVIITPLSATLVAQIGLVDAAPMLGVVYVVGVIPIAWLLLRPDPVTAGIVPPSRFFPIHPNSQRAANTDKQIEVANIVSTGLSFKQVIRGRFFWCFSAAYVFLMMAQVGGIAHQYGLARETLSETQTAAAVAILPIASIIGRLIGGWIVEQFSIRAFAITMMAIQSLSLLLLSVGSGVAALCIGLALFGSSVGNLLMLQPLLVSEAFGVKDYARIFAFSNLMTSWGTAFGPWILGFVYGLSQNNYGLAYAVAATAGLLGLILFLSGGPLHSQE